MGRSMRKFECLDTMEFLYTVRGYTDAEMAEELDVDRPTAYRYRIELRNKGLPIEAIEPGRYRLPHDYAVSKLKLNLYEALALYLAARRASRQARTGQPHLAHALLKTARALKQPMTERLAAAAGAILEQEADTQRIQVIEEVAKAWAARQKLEISYQGLRSRESRQYLVSPYLIEPALWGESAYLIGPAEPALGPVMTFKLERIATARMKLERFEIPADFDEAALLQYAWGIWFSEGAPLRVRLRFRGRAAVRRLGETVWVPGQVISDPPEADGSVTWEAQVAEWQEMLAWVRGWGSSVEVLEPVEMREALMREARRLAKLYEVGAPVDSQTMYFAHSRPDLPEDEWQPLKEHLRNTAEIAARLGEDAGVAELARACALVHDLGKYSAKFQARLRGATEKVDHATAGAKELISLFPSPPNSEIAEVLSYCIVGHHSGLPDYGDPTDLPDAGTLLARRDKKVLENYSAYRSELDLAALTLPMPSLTPTPGKGNFSVSFLTRMIFSVLVDADWLETETYMEERPRPRGEYEPLESLRQRLDAYLQRFENPQQPIHQKRTETLHACIRTAQSQPGFFSLTVPTGGGKTLASMAFALHHAVKHGLKRIIYVIPFTSIIEQNAAVFKDILGEENVLEHHSNFDWDQFKKGAGKDDETSRVFEKLKLASENWDIPIVVTTNVQFFESLFASKKSRARKVHNMAKSVLIFDEAQMLPREYLQPCLLAVRELVQNYGASAVFCTATQPNLQPLLPGVQFTELAPDPQALFDFYRRVRIRPVGTLVDADLAAQVNAQPQALCIVNTRRHARGLFTLLDEDGRYHLSTLMCPAHRKQTLLTIRQRLQNGQTCRVVSTQVLEAGVDLDFPVGYRALAGLDSVIQAAGRVNRERRNPEGDVFVFEPQTDYIKRTPAFIQQTAQAAKSIFRDFEAHPDSLEAIHTYFDLLDTLQDPQRSADVKSILAYLNKPRFEFARAAENFRIIENPTVAVIVPFDEHANDLLQQVKFSTYPASYVRRLQSYTVNLYPREFENLQAKGVIETYQEMYFVLNDLNYYDRQTGIVLPTDQGGEAIFFD